MDEMNKDSIFIWNHTLIFGVLWTPSISIGINSASKWIKQPSVADPEFEVVSAGLGSMLHVKLPSRSELYAAPGAAIGSSADV